MLSFNCQQTPVVLIVDDMSEDLSTLQDVLDEAGYTVHVVNDGATALERARQDLPDVILLDAIMPDMDSFEVARQLKSDVSTLPIPIFFMTDFAERDYIHTAFAAGGVDCLNKPIRPAEVLARIEIHLQHERQMHQARSALDAFGQATVAIRPHDYKIVWQTPLARTLLMSYFAAPEVVAPEALVNWAMAAQTAYQNEQPPSNLVVAQQNRRLLATFHGQTDDDETWLIVLREENDASAVDALIAAFRLTQREAEVLYWVVQGKTTKDIGSILGSSPRTVNKHLEHIFEKLGVETRTAAAYRALAKIRGK